MNPPPQGVGKVGQDRADHEHGGPGAAVRHVLSELGGLRRLPGLVGPEQSAGGTGTDAGAWLPDGYSQIFRSLCVWPFGLLDYGSATLRCKI